MLRPMRPAQSDTWLLTLIAPRLAPEAVAAVAACVFRHGGRELERTPLGHGALQAETWRLALTGDDHGLRADLLALLQELAA